MGQLFSIYLIKRYNVVVCHFSRFVEQFRCTFLMRPNLVIFTVCFLIIFFDKVSPNENYIRNEIHRKQGTFARGPGHPEPLAELTELKIRKTKGW